MCEEKLCDQAGKRHLIAGLGRLHPVHIVVELPGHSSKVAQAEGCRDHARGLTAAQVVADALVVDEKEELVLDDRAAEGATGQVCVNSCLGVPA